MTFYLKRQERQSTTLIKHNVQSDRFGFEIAFTYHKNLSAHNVSFINCGLFCNVVSKTIVFNIVLNTGGILD